MTRRRWLILVALGLTLGASIVAGCCLGFSSARRPSLSAPVRGDTLVHDGVERTHLVFAPAQLRPKAPLVVVLHGGLSNGEETREYTAFELDALADEHGFVTAYPHGIDGVWNSCRKLPDSPETDDVGYLGALIDSLVKELDVDPTRVFMVGYSNGGDMALRMAIEAPERVRAIAVISSNLPADENMGCGPATRPVPVLLMNGTADPIIPYEGGTVTLLWMDRGAVRSTDATLDFFRAAAGIDSAPRLDTLPDTQTDDESRVERLTWRAETGVEVVLYRIVDGGHTVPHPDHEFPRFVVGVTNHDINGPREIWAFFERSLGEAPE